MSIPRHTNLLIREKSPYLLQHAHNPVDWNPWGKEAFDKAREEDKLLLVSIGYATCHWCHVMERESFEDPQTATFLNNHFVPVKVDREERPDVDKVYMDALHALGQQGGWPLNMFITHEGMPVAGGTYFPPKELYGRPSFRSILETMAQVWSNDRGRILETANRLTGHLRRQAVVRSVEGFKLDWQAEDQTVAFFRKTFDDVNGGFSLQPQNKFPPSMGLQLLLRHHHRTGDNDSLKMVEFTLRKMIKGGIYDQLGGGLSRYSTDYQWMVPHFEKMLYDNALLVWTLIETYQTTGEPFYETAARDVLGYVERDMLSENGGFCSAEDADSGGVEGQFYVWRKEEVMKTLGKELGEQACRFWNISEEGNFEGKNIPHQSESETAVAKIFGITPSELRGNLEIARDMLLQVRAQRERPLCDDKILTSWNALMISAFARASRVFTDAHYQQIAEGGAEFIWWNMRDGSGRLLRRWREGDASLSAYLCDYAQLALACLDLYETSYRTLWFQRCIELIDTVIMLFRSEDGPYFDTGNDAETLIVRNAESYDGVEPSGNSTIALVLLKLYAYGLSGQYHDDGWRILRCFGKRLHDNGVNSTAMMQALHFSLAPPREVVVAGERGEKETENLLAVLRKEFHPDCVTAFVPRDEEQILAELIPLTKGRTSTKGRPTAYVCRRQSCLMPVHDADSLRVQLKA